MTLEGSFAFTSPMLPYLCLHTVTSLWNYNHDREHQKGAIAHDSLGHYQLSSTTKFKTVIEIWTDTLFRFIVCLLADSFGRKTWAFWQLCYKKHNRNKLDYLLKSVQKERRSLAVLGKILVLTGGSSVIIKFLFSLHLPICAMKRLNRGYLCI